MTTRSVNKAMAVGYLGKGCRHEIHPKRCSGHKVQRGTVSRRWKDSQSDEWKEETDWHNSALETREPGQLPHEGQPFRPSCVSVWTGTRYPKRTPFVNHLRARRSACTRP
jgi:hypothetical protein